MQCALDLLLDAVHVEQRPRTVVQLDVVGHCRGVAQREVEHGLVRFDRIDQHAPCVFAGEIAQHALGQRQILMHQRASAGGAGSALHVGPELGEVLNVAGQIALGGAFGHGADDEAAASVVLGQQLGKRFLQQRALGFVLNALRDADVRVLWQMHQQASRQ